MPRLTPARYRIRAAWVAALLLALTFVSCWKVDAFLVVSTHQISFATTKVTDPIWIKNDSEDNALTSGVVTLEYTLKSNRPWLTVTPVSGACGAMEKRSHTVAVDRSLMQYGENLATISVTSNGGNATIKVSATRSLPGCALGPAAAVVVAPTSGATAVATDTELLWSEGDSRCEQLTATYDVYFGTTSPPAFDHDNDTLKVWNPGPLANNTTYYWRIVVKDGNGEVRGPQWTFRTLCDAGPNAPTLISPANNATNVGVYDDIHWGGGLSQCSGLTSSYDVYFGTVSPPPFRAHTTLKYWDPGTLDQGTAYYWKIVSKDANGSTPSPERSFVTTLTTCTLPPTAVQLLTPADGAANVSVNDNLSWGGGVSQCAGLSSTYDVYFGTASPPPFQHNTAVKFWDPGTMANATTYYWKIVAKDASGSTSSSQRSFTTAAIVCTLPPAAVTLVAPANGATVASLDQILSWIGGASQCAGKTSTYDVYFGTASPPPLDHNNGTSTTWSPALQYSTTYYWRIVAKDDNGATSSELRTFKTPCHTPPSALNLLSPADHAVGVSIDANLSWGGGVSQCPGLTSSYDVYFGTASPPPFQHNTTLKFWDPGTMANGVTYHWKIVAKDANGSTSSAERSFTTAAIVCTLPPAAVTLVAPADGAAVASLDQILSWSGGASQCAGRTSTYDVYFGTTSSPPFDHNNGTSTTWSPALQYNTTYYWRVVARDDNGESSSTERSFTTPCHLPPGAIGAVAPEDNETGVALGSDISWSGGDSSCPGASPTYDVYFGITSSPPLVASSVAEKTFDPGLLLNGLTYYWRIVAKDANGETSSPVFRFQTELLPCLLPPNAACTPAPPNNKFNANRDSDLSWGCGDSPCGKAVTYDVYFGTTATLGDEQKVGSDVTSKSFALPRLVAGQKYYWKIITKDANGTTPGPTWNFTVKA